LYDLWNGKVSDRMYCSIQININLTPERQKQAVLDWNSLVNEYREKYTDMWLSLYRDRGRRRITFELAFKILNYVLVCNDR